MMTKDKGTIQMSNKEEHEQLIWVKNRIEKLDRIETKLQEMKCLAELARDHDLSREEIVVIQKKINQLNQEINTINAQIDVNYH
jgi:outer membrane murein-binding lipoprotein Lpp